MDRPRLVGAALVPADTAASHASPFGQSSGHGYHERVSQITPPQDPELRYYEPEREPVREYEPIHPESRWRDLSRRLWAPIAALGYLLFKFKTALLAIFKFKIFTTSASMLVSLGAYAWLWGWKFALGFILLLFVHELGHYLEARRQGLDVGAPVFIPFLGAAILLKQNPLNAWREAQIAIAGPIVGSIGAAVVWLIGERQDSELLVALGFTGFFLNLFNLLPVVPLDGGRIAAAIHPALWFVGFLGLVGLAFVAPNPLLIVIALIVGLELWRRWQERGMAEAEGYYKVERWQRVAASVGYFGLAALLVLGMSASFVDRKF